MNVRDLTVEQFKVIVHEALEEALLDLLGDPDAGLSLREEVKEELLASLARTQRGEPGIPADEVARELGLGYCSKTCLETILSDDHPTYREFHQYRHSV